MGLVFTRLSEDVHATVVVHPVSATPADRGDLVPARVIERIPSEQPVVPLVGVRVVDTQLEFALVQVGHFTVVRRGLRSGRNIGITVVNRCFKQFNTNPKLKDKHLNSVVSRNRMHSFLQSSSVFTEITFLIADDSSLAGDPYPR